MIRPALWACLLLLAVGVAWAESERATLAERNELLFQKLKEERGLSDAEIRRLREIFARSGFIGQGNPAITQHPMSEAQCASAASRQGVEFDNARFDEICGAKFMAPLYDPKTSSPERATACIDRFEFPNIPCTYPVVWVKAVEAAEICEAEGERLCDAHEWEGACAGSLQPPDYRFDLAKGVSPEVAITRMRAAHNAAHQADKSWSYGPQYQRGICATGSFKTPGCPGGGWNLCGSNTYPSGSFPACRSSLGVYDLNGNAAEHMNLPLSPDEMSSRGSKQLGYTEMKGSWFIFDTYRAHEDWCRWRAPFWHGTRVMDPHSHANYHLGFRCCKTIAPQAGNGAD
ncbi:MAG TPA: SUMF1/EgtB/PvdO family nonheme iron enzyme [Steroidobacteraceae bacterium]|nr:SUMF1/EgtB/PvdO family nonheme iron enzyme [Steroidobacteraceae bacterium]